MFQLSGFYRRASALEIVTMVDRYKEPVFVGTWSLREE